VIADLAAATGLAAQLVGAMGAGGSRLSLQAAAVAGAGNLVAKVLADDAARAAAESLVAEAETAARQLVGTHRDALVALAAALIERDELSGAEVRAVLADHDAWPLTGVPSTPVIVLKAASRPDVTPEP
jgi:ATP-dependent Zn protease